MSVSSDLLRKILPIDCSANQTWLSCPGQHLVTTELFDSATPPASTSSQKVSIGFRISVGRCNPSSRIAKTMRDPTVVEHGTLQIKNEGRVEYATGIAFCVTDGLWGDFSLRLE